MTTAPARAPRSRQRRRRFRSSEPSVEQNRKAEDAGGRTLSPPRRHPRRAGGGQRPAAAAGPKAGPVRYNAARAQPVPERHALLSECLAHVGAGTVIRPPFFCDFGYNIRFGGSWLLIFIIVH